MNIALNKGGIVLLPTETVYGLAADAKNQSAIDKLYALKGRNFKKPIAICISDISHAASLVHWNNTAQKLAEAFWPGPLSLVLPAKDNLELDTRLYGQFADGTPSLSLRNPQAIWCENLGVDYLALTSANKSGQKDNMDFQPAFDIFGHDIAAALKGQSSSHGMASTIVAIKNHRCRILRTGALNPSDFASFNLDWDIS